MLKYNIMTSEKHFKWNFLSIIKGVENEGALSTKLLAERSQAGKLQDHCLSSQSKLKAPFKDYSELSLAKAPMSINVKPSQAKSFKTHFQI